MRNVFLIGIGGTGMRCLESFVHTCAMGMYDNTDVHILALDTDSNNGNFERLRSTVDAYKKVNGDKAKSETFFSASINYYEFTPGYTDESSYESISNYSNEKAHNEETHVSDLVDIFLDDPVRRMNLKHGYRAQTQLGSMLMYHAIIREAYKSADRASQLRDFLKALLSADNQPVFVFGSVFGGTGASSIPIIPLAFREACKLIGGESKDIIASNFFGSIVLTSYFRFDVSSSNPDEVIARSENFAINSQAALMFYNSDKTVREAYRRLYLLGRTTNESRDVIKGGAKGVTGGDSQKNPADYIELIAAFAAYDFFEECKRGKEAFDRDGNKKFLCIAHNYESRKLDFPLFAQGAADTLKKKFGLLLVASWLDIKGNDFFFSTAKRLFPTVDVDGAQFKSLQKYFGLFNVAVNDRDELVKGWLPQMNESRGGHGILFNDNLFTCSDLKSYRKYKINENLFAGDNPQTFKVGLMSSIIDKVKSRFNEVKTDRMTSFDDLMARTYATLLNLYFNE